MMISRTPHVPAEFNSLLFSIKCPPKYRHFQLAEYCISRYTPLASPLSPNTVCIISRIEARHRANAVLHRFRSLID